MTPARLLQNVVTSDIDALAVGEGQYGLALTPKGQPIADAWIVREADDAFVCACETVARGRPRGHAAALPARLARRHRRRSRVSCTLLERPLAAPAEGWHAGPLGALLLARARRGARGLGRRARRGRRARSAPRRARRCASSSGLPRFGVDFDASNLPAEAGVVERAISFTKGCYIGQEPIVRLAHRGHANRELRRLHLGEALEVCPRRCSTASARSAA